MRIARFLLAPFFIAMFNVNAGAARQAPPTTKPAAPAAAPAAPAAPDPSGAKLNAADDEPIVSRVRVMESKPYTYFYSTTETTINDLQTVIPQMWMAMEEQIKSGAVHPAGPIIIVHQNMTGDRGKPFTLELGFPVAEDQKEIGEYKVRKLEPMKNANLIFSGPVKQIAGAYQQLFTELFTNGLQPTGETREMYLYFESPESLGNVVVIMAGVK